MLNVLIVNGALAGANGNSAQLLGPLSSTFEKSSFKVQTQVLNLNESIPFERVSFALDQADAFVFITGTYWDSWSSHMQNFLEQATEWEASSKFLGKPAAVLVTMHSVGGKEVASRLQGVLNNFGCLIPPMSSLVISLATELARKSLTTIGDDFSDDFWSTADLPALVSNLLLCCRDRSEFSAWDVDRKDPTRIWLK